MGLDKAERLAPGSGYLDFRSVLTPEAAAATLEAGWKPKAWLTAYATARGTYRWGGPLRGYVGVGIRGTF